MDTTMLLVILLILLMVMKSNKKEKFGHPFGECPHAKIPPPQRTAQQEAQFVKCAQCHRNPNPNSNASYTCPEHKNFVKKRGATAIEKQDKRFTTFGKGKVTGVKFVNGKPTAVYGSSDKSTAKIDFSRDAKFQGKPPSVGLRTGVASSAKTSTKSSGSSAICTALNNALGKLDKSKETYVDQLLKLSEQTAKNKC